MRNMGFSPKRSMFFHGCVVALGFTILVPAYAVKPFVPKADALLSVDLNRTAVVEKIALAWEKEIPVAQHMSFRAKLIGLRADQLLAANLSGSFDGVLEVLNAGESNLAVQNTPTAKTAQSVQTGDQSKALGDVNQDLVYTPIAPCRVFDTRTPNTPFISNGLSSGVGQTFDMDGTNLSAQGGSGTGCNIPTGARAVVLAFSPLAPPTTGWFVGAANDGSPLPGSTLFNYSSALTLTTFTVVMPMLGQAGGDIRLEARGVAAYAMHGVGDVTGYFMPPSRNGEGLRVIQTSFANTPNTIDGSSQNSISASAPGSTIAGGGGGAGLAIPSIAASDTFTFGPNAIVGSASASTIGGGARNLIEQNAAAVNTVFATIGGGYNNKIYSYFGTIAGGASNISGQAGANSFGGTVSGGFGNNVFSSYGTISGGNRNQASFFATVPGGTDNLAVSSYSFAAGRGASTGNDASAAVRYNGAFVWADSNANGAVNAPFYASATDQFAVRARGGIVFKVAAATSAGDATAGCSLPAGGAASWSCSSDRNLKDDIKAISPKDVLSRVVNLPLSTWQFKGTNRRHLSPMAQDFWAAFGFGEDDRHITASDVSGVALAAVQGVHNELNVLKAKNAQLQRSNESMRRTTESLQRELAAVKKKLGL
jgi:hypothetical protein